LPLPVTSFKPSSFPKLLTVCLPRQGFQRVYSEMPDISLDVPNAYFYLEQLVNKCYDLKVIGHKLKIQAPNRSVTLQDCCVYRGAFRLCWSDLFARTVLLVSAYDQSLAVRSHTRKLCPIEDLEYDHCCMVCWCEVDFNYARCISPVSFDSPPSNDLSSSTSPVHTWQSFRGGRCAWRHMVQWLTMPWLIVLRFAKFGRCWIQWKKDNATHYLPRSERRLHEVRLRK